MPIVKSSPIPELQQFYFHHEINTPQSCVAEREKLSNIDRQLAALKAHKETFLRQNSDFAFFNSAILAGTLIRETCYSFLDLTSAIAGDILDGVDPSGKTSRKVDITASLGMASIDMSQKMSEYTHGYSTFDDVAEQGAKSMFSVGKSLAPKNDKTVKNALHFGDSAMQAKGIQRDRRKGKLPANSLKAKRAAEGMAIDQAIFILDGYEDRLLGPDKAAMGRLKTGLKLVKAAGRYNQALEDAFESYRQSGEEQKANREIFAKVFQDMIRQSEEKLQEALLVYGNCRGTKDVGNSPMFNDGKRIHPVGGRPR